MRLNSSNSRADRESLGENIEQALSYSLDEEDRQSEDGSVTSSMERRRVRTHSEVSSDDGTERDRDGALPNTPSQPRSSVRPTASIRDYCLQQEVPDSAEQCVAMCFNLLLAALPFRM
jgi:hypothetical protein